MLEVPFKTIAYFWPDKLFYITKEDDRGDRYHEVAPCRVLSIGIYGPIKVTTYHDGVKKEMYARTVFHDMHSDYGDQFTDNVVCNLFVDPASALNEKLQNKMTQRVNGVAVKIENEEAVLESFQRVYHQGLSQEHVDEIMREYYDWPNDGNWQAEHIDERVVRAIDIYKANLDQRLTAADLADRVCVSESRLFYLFRRDLGISLSRYILWARFVNFARIVLEEKNLLRAALRVGFWDAAHMTRTFRKFTGASTSKLLQTVIKSKFVTTTADKSKRQKN